MSRGPFRQIIRRLLAVTFSCLAIALWLNVPAVNAQQLSIRHYDVSDGLAHSHVTAMHQDAKGYLWLATWEGLSRFDGYRFTNYGLRDGLGDPIINAIAEDRQGRIWVGTNGGGVACLVDDSKTANSSTPRQKFVSFRVGDSDLANRINRLIFDSQNNLWCATDGGLYRAAINGSSEVKFETIISEPIEMDTAFADSQGRLWFGMQNTLIEIIGGQMIKYGADDLVGVRPIKSIIQDRDGQVLVANDREVFRFSAPPDNKDRGRWQKLPLSFKGDQGIETLLSDRDGVLWIGTWDGLAKFRDGKQTVYRSVHGLSDNDISSLTEDRNGNLWIGTRGGGVCKLSELIVSFTRAEGLPNQSVARVFEDRAGNIYASVHNGGLVRMVEGRAEPLPGSETPPFTDFNERIIQDLRGDWWVGTDAGLFHFTGPELQFLHGRKITANDGLPEGPMQGGLYQDANGRIWVNPTGFGLYYLDPYGRAPGVFQSVAATATSPIPSVLRIVGDRSGELWLGANERLGRFADGRVVMLQPTAGLPEANPRSFFVDSRGWLWIGLRYKGVSVTKDPTAESPIFTNYSAATGLASDSVWTIAEDDLGRMYFGTGKGLDQLDLITGRVRHFNTDDGLTSDVINSCFKDREGNIWVGTTLGLSKFNPHAERPTDQPAPIYLSRITVAGEDLPLPETGVLHVPELELAASRNNLLIQYVALSFQGEDKLSYQYKLEGVDNDWSAATEVRSVNYARLGPGSYRFLVRAINSEGIVSPDAATFQFRILRPIWQRWWFLMLLGLLIAMTIYAVHRQRTARLIELERVRTRIATDLHDDIGANLSLIAMLSEVARGQMQSDDHRLKEWFSTIATTSRDTVDAMSDIVWAVNPKRDQLRDLTQRMRRFADDIFGARDIALSFQAVEPGRDVRVGADVRREVFLIFKEAVNNIVRHSRCVNAKVELRLERRWLVLEMIDDGKGFDPTRASEGNGLASMRQRAHKLGGTLEVISPNGHGTTVTLRVPLGQRART